MEWKENFGMEYAKIKWKERFQERNGKQSSILHTRFRALYLQKNIYRCLVVTNDSVKEVFNFNIYGYYSSTNCGSLVVYIAQTLYVLCHSKYIAICSIDDLTGFNLFFLRLTVCQVVILFFSSIVTTTCICYFIPVSA